MATEFKAEDTDLESWIEDNVSFLQAEVTIYRDPGMYREYGPLLERIQILERELQPKKRPKPRGDQTLDEGLGDDQATEFPGEESVGEETELDQDIKADLEKSRARAAELFAEYEKNTEVWVIRRLNEDEIVQVKGEMEGWEIPTQPNDLTPKANRPMKKAYLEKMQKWASEMQAYEKELNIRCLSLATISITVPGRDGGKPRTMKYSGSKKDGDFKPAISEDGVRRLMIRPGGDAHFDELRTAMKELSIEGVAIMAPHREGTGA